MPGYVVYEGVVTDPDRYERYKPKAAASIEAAGGRYLVRGGEIELLEGDAPAGRIVILEFATRQAAVDWYYSDAYAEARELRRGAARARMFAIDGWE
jgi:uncharacterized protein (DUF1330 family)